MNADMSNLIGRRIRLLHAEDPDNKLKYGSLGTIKDIAITPHEEIVVWVKWYNGSNLALIHPLDSFEFVD